MAFLLCLFGSVKKMERGLCRKRFKKMHKFNEGQTKLGLVWGTGVEGSSVGSWCGGLLLGKEVLVVKSS